MISKKEFEKMADYFRQKYFDNIPKIPYKVVADTNINKGVDASFVIEQNEDYDEDNDELLNSPEYSKRVEFADGFGFDYGNPSWIDPLNHPKMYIEIRRSLLSDELKLVGVLLHELTHYWCWYCGYDHTDGSKQFEDKLKELKLPSNWEHAGFIKDKKKWVDIFDYSTMKDYFDDFVQNGR